MYCTEKGQPISVQYIYNINEYWPTKMINVDKEELKLCNAYPNPSNGTYTIEYELPEDVERAEIVFYSLTGVELKRYTVDNTFNTLIVNNKDFPKGTYIYKLITSTEASNSKKNYSKIISNFKNMNAPTNLKHKPIIVVNDYDIIDAEYA